MTLPYLRANVGTLLNGGTFGVGQPITVWFDERISDKAAAERTLTVTTDPPGVVGGWYWMDDHEVHWRPKDYWPTNTKVTVTAKVYGKDLGGGLYGQQDVSATFTIAEHSHLAVADHDTKMMKVYIDGVQVTSIAGHDVTAGIPISMGKGGSETQASGVVVDFRTNSGPHVVTLKLRRVPDDLGQLRHHRPEVAELLRHQHQEGDADLRRRRVRAPGRLEHPPAGPQQHVARLHQRGAGLHQLVLRPRSAPATWST